MKKLTVPKLKERLRELRLPLSGKKAELLDRLMRSMANSADAAIEECAPKVVERVADVSRVGGGASRGRAVADTNKVGVGTLAHATKSRSAAQLRQQNLGEPGAEAGSGHIAAASSRLRRDGRQADALIHRSRWPKSRVTIGDSVKMRRVSADNGNSQLGKLMVRRGDHLRSHRGDVSAFLGVSPLHWLRGELVRKGAGHAFVRVKHPNRNVFETGILSSAEAPSFAELECGDVVRMRIVAVDLVAQKLILSMRDDPSTGRLEDADGDVDAFHDVDGWLSGVVSRLDPFGVFVDVEHPQGGCPVIGFVEMTHITEDARAALDIGRKLDVRVLRVSHELGRLMLTMRAEAAEG